MYFPTHSPPLSSTRRSISRSIMAGRVTTAFNTYLLHHGFRRRSGFDRNRSSPRPCNLQSAGLDWKGIESTGCPIDPFHVVSVVRLFHPRAWRHGVDYGIASEYEPHVRRGRERRLDWVPGFRLGNGARRSCLVARLTADRSPCSCGAKDGSVHGRVDQGPVRVVGPHNSTKRKGYLAALLAEWHYAQFDRIR